jgi:hypothetical protein
MRLLCTFTNGDTRYNEIMLLRGVKVMENAKKLFMFGVLICLIVIALKPNPSLSYNQPSFPNSISTSSGESVVQLGENRIAIVDTNINSGMRGTMLVFEFDKSKKKFNFIGSDNYVDYFRNPNKYNLQLP